MIAIDSLIANNPWDVHLRWCPQYDVPPFLVTLRVEPIQENPMADGLPLYAALVEIDPLLAKIVLGCTVVPFCAAGVLAAIRLTRRIVDQIKQPALVTAKGCLWCFTDLRRQLVGVRDPVLVAALRFVPVVALWCCVLAGMVSVGILVLTGILRSDYSQLTAATAGFIGLGLVLDYLNGIRRWQLHMLRMKLAGSCWSVLVS